MSYPDVVGKDLDDAMKLLMNIEGGKIRVKDTKAPRSVADKKAESRTVVVKQTEENGELVLVVAYF